MSSFNKGYNAKTNGGPFLKSPPKSPTPPKPPTGESLESDLLKNACAYSFEMAAYILEHGKPISFGKHINVAQAPFNTTSLNVFHLRGTEIEKIETVDGIRTVFIERLALSGLNAPLPTPYGELIFQRTHEQDDAMASFINVFNSRLLGISYQISKRRHLNLQDHSGDNCLFVRNLAALCGEDLYKMDRRFSRVSSLFWNKEKSASGLESLIKSLFGFDTHVLQFRRIWTAIGEDNRLLSGRKHLGINAGLGMTAIVSNLGITIELKQKFDKVYELLASNLYEHHEKSAGNAEQGNQQNFSINPPKRGLLQQLYYIIQKYIGDFYIYKLKVRPYFAPAMRVISERSGGSGYKSILGRTAWLSSAESGVDGSKLDFANLD